MNTLETDVEISADGSLKLLSLKPERVIPTATPDILAKRVAVVGFCS